MRPEKEIFGGNPGRTIHEPAHLWTERPKKRRTAPTVVRYPLFDKISVYRNGFTPALGVIGACFEGWNPLLIQLIVCLPALFIILTNLVFPRLCRLMKTCTLALSGLALYVLSGAVAFYIDDIWARLVLPALMGLSPAMNQMVHPSALNDLCRPSGRGHGYESPCLFVPFDRVE